MKSVGVETGAEEGFTKRWVEYRCCFLRLKKIPGNEHKQQKGHVLLCFLSIILWTWISVTGREYPFAIPHGREGPFRVVILPNTLKKIAFSIMDGNWYLSRAAGTLIYQKVSFFLFFWMFFNRHRIYVVDADNVYGCIWAFSKWGDPQNHWFQYSSCEFLDDLWVSPF